MDAKTAFSRHAGDYDRTRRQLVPDFDNFYGMALELIPYAPAADLRVLDLGAGTGLFSAMIGAAYPNARLTLADFSPQMLDQARQRFADRQVEYLLLDYEHDAIPGDYDVAISALALHHTPPAGLQAVFEKIHGALVSGGLFINADQTLGTSAENEARYAQAWIDAVKANGSTDADVAAALDRMKADQTATLEDQLAALRGAGFTDVDCWYKRYRFAVYSGRKP